MHQVDLEEAANPASASITTIRTPRQPPARSRSNSLASTTSEVASSAFVIAVVKEEPDSGQEGLLSVRPMEDRLESDESGMALEAHEARGRGGGEGLPQTPTTARPSRAALVGWSNRVSELSLGSVAQDGLMAEPESGAVDPFASAEEADQVEASPEDGNGGGCVGDGQVPTDGFGSAGRDSDQPERLHSRRNASASLSISVPPASTPSHSALYGSTPVQVASPAALSDHHSHSSTDGSAAYFFAEPVASPTVPMPPTAMPRLTRLPIEDFPLGIEEVFEHGREYKWPEKLELAARELWFSFVGHCRTIGLAIRAGRFE